jgi:hypothetical protein
MTQVVEIDANRGMFDYLRQIVVLGPGEQQVSMKNVNTATWGTPVALEDVPPKVLERTEHPSPTTNLRRIDLLQTNNLASAENAADLGPLVATSEVSNAPFSPAEGHS